MDFTKVIEDESAALAAALHRTGTLTGVVPACPGWTGDALAKHIGEVQDFWTHVVRAGGELPKVAEAEPGSADVAEWYDGIHGELAKALRETPPDQRLWAWWRKGGDSAHEVGRRQAHEVLVHRWDAQSVLGDPRPLSPPELAADGVSEYCERMLGGSAAWTGPAGTLRLVASDTGDQWLLRLDPRPALVDVGAEPLATVTGTASDLDLWLWRRGEEVRVDGDAAVVGAFRDWADLN